MIDLWNILAVWFLGLNIFLKWLIGVIGAAIVGKLLDILYKTLFRKNEISEKDKMLFDEHYRSGIFKGILGTLGAIGLLSWLSGDEE